MNSGDICIGQRTVGSSSKVFVVAEIGINHDGSLEQAHKLVDAAADAGADAVKFQTFRADRLMAPVEARFAQQEPGAESAYQLFRRLELSREAHEQLKAHADARGVVFLSTPFDEESADFLDQLGVPAFKIASSDITHTPLLRRVATKRKPVLLSTGMSYLGEVSDAILALKSAGAKEILLLHCVSLYPAPPETLNLRSIETMRNHFGLPVGYSDHCEGFILPLAAVALGAVLLEKHFTLSRDLPGPDHKVSMEPAELRILVQYLQDVEASLGDGRKHPASAEEENRKLSRRSISVTADIRAYEVIAPWMLAVKRPGTGLEPRQLESVIGMRARRNISKNSILQWEDLVPAMPPWSADHPEDADSPPQNGHPNLRHEAGKAHARD
jgi:N-acetylneuraminate synthase/N,N'-diacetyllegionaminate synthase